MEHKQQTVVCQAPGRVNIIGEHIDYNGLHVLPMAIDRYVTVHMLQTHSQILTIHITNHQPQLYTDRILEFPDGNIHIEHHKHHWTNYVLCGLKGVLEIQKLRYNMKLIIQVDGDIPPGAGLSSSSALVCATTTAFVELLGLNMTSSEIADLCGKSERYVGTAGGGMDQAVSMLAQEGSAMNIEFVPSLKAIPVPLPNADTYSWVVCHSNVQSLKGSTSRLAFNTRVIECKLATSIIEELTRKDEEFEEFPDSIGLIMHQRDYKLSLILETIENHFYRKSVSRYELDALLPRPVFAKEEILQSITNANEVLELKESFPLYQRISHVVREAERVQKFIDECCGDCDPNVLGDLMNQSHYSLQNQYECTCPELDKLQIICLESGAIGSRMTGAGWGGCVISLVPVVDLEQFRLGVINRYYKTEFPEEAFQENWMFVTNPGSGARVYRESSIQ